MKQVSFADGRRAWALNASDAALLHHQIFEAGAYAGHGITLHDGACVFDVGANIGLFALWLSTRHQGLRFFAFEPIPAVFAALQKNCPGGQLFQCGLAARAGSAAFSWDPFVSSTATMHPEALRATMAGIGGAAWAEAVAADLAQASVGPRVSGPIARVAVGALDFARRLTTRQVVCPLRTVSDVIAEHRVEAIDLLKIDAEGAEGSVLEGIADADWPKIRQVIVETHEADRLGALLRDRGFAVVVGQEPWRTFQLLGLRNLYASRPPGH